MKESVSENFKETKQKFRILRRSISKFCHRSIQQELHVAFERKQNKKCIRNQRMLMQKNIVTRFKAQCFGSFPSDGKTT